MSWASDLPVELTNRAVALVALAGLNISQNAVHMAVWDSFTNNRRDERVPLRFLNLPPDFEYPKCKTKRTNYEWYIPRGILRTHWMHKHLEEIPSLIVLFFDIEWSCLQWEERIQQYSTTVEIVRNTINNRNTKIAIVLIQTNDPLPPGDDMTTTMSKYSLSICNACGISSKYLFVLPSNDHLIGYTIRLENKFYDLAQNYYQAEIKNIRSHRDQVNKTTHHLLFVRHQFKMGFFSEMRNDPPSALKHYAQAYRFLQEVPLHNTNILEAKTIAGFINYKICKLSFQCDNAIEAINQFRKHIDFFRAKIGRTELKFEHSAWMSKQFHIFGDLFEEAITEGGLKALKIQQPGFYYQLAADYLIRRKKEARVLCKNLPESFSPDPCTTLNSLVYYGQRPWREQTQSLEPADNDLENRGILSLQHLESFVNHSALIIPLFTSSIRQFRVYGSVRITLQLMVDLAKEYYTSGDPEKALVLLNRVTLEYRKERWWIILTPILNLALKCAYLVENQKDYIQLCLELICDHSKLPLEDKTRIQANLQTVINEKQPAAEPGLLTKDNPQDTMWNLTQSGIPFSVNMSNINAFIECRVLFDQTSYELSDTIHIDICLYNQAPKDIQLNHIYVNYNNEIYDSKCKKECISIPSCEYYVISFSFSPIREDINKTIQVNTITGSMGHVNLRWSFDLVPEQSLTVAETGTRYRRRASELTEWSDIHTKSIAKIENSIPLVKVSLSSADVCLFNENFPVYFQVDNPENEDVTNVKLLYYASCGNKRDDVKLHISLDEPQFNDTCVTSLQDENIASISAGSQLKKVIYFKCVQACEVNITCKMTYDLRSTLDGAVCSLENLQSVTFTVINPFLVQSCYKSMKFKDIAYVHVNDHFILSTEVKNLYTEALVIHTSAYCLYNTVSTECNLDSQLNNLTLHEGELATECHRLSLEDTAHEEVQLGTYTLTWARQDCPYPSTSTFPLPGAQLKPLPLSVHIEVTEPPKLHHPFTVIYTLYNRTPAIHKFTVTLSDADANSFIFSGHKQIQLRMLPNSEQKFTYLLVPLNVGEHRLPLIRVDPESMTPPRPFDPLMADKVIKYQRRMQTSSVFVQV